MISLSVLSLFFSSLERSMTVFTMPADSLSSWSIEIIESMIPRVCCVKSIERVFCSCMLLTMSLIYCLVVFRLSFDCEPSSSRFSSMPEFCSKDELIFVKSLIIASMFVVISDMELSVFSASFRTSSATTAKPRP